MQIAIEALEGAIRNGDMTHDGALRSLDMF